TNFTGTVAVTNRNRLTGTFTVAATGDQITRSSGTWDADGFAPNQPITINGLPGTWTVAGFDPTMKTMLVRGAALPAGSQTWTIGVVRVGGDNINVTGASDVVNGTFNIVAPNMISRASGDWKADGFVVNQQVTLTGGVSGQFMVAGLTDPVVFPDHVEYRGLLLKKPDGSAATLTAQTGVALTVDINSPLVVYGDT